MANAPLILLAGNPRVFGLVLGLALLFLGLANAGGSVLAVVLELAGLVIILASIFPRAFGTLLRSLTWEMSSTQDLTQERVKRNFSGCIARGKGCNGGIVGMVVVKSGREEFRFEVCAAHVSDYASGSGTGKANLEKEFRDRGIPLDNNFEFETLSL